MALCGLDLLMFFHVRSLIILGHSDAQLVHVTNYICINLSFIPFSMEKCIMAILETKSISFFHRLTVCIITLSISLSFFTPAHARDIFYFLVGDSIELYSRDGVFQKSYPLPSYQDASPKGMATDGVKAWISYTAEHDYIDRMPLATAPALDGVFPTNSNPGGFYGGVAVSGSTIFLARNHIDPAIPNRIEKYNDTTLAYSDDSFETGDRSFPASLQVNGGTLFVVASSDNVRRYSLDGIYGDEFDASDILPGYSIAGVCADDTYVWVFFGTDTAYAYTHAGVRTAGQDIVFEGLSSAKDVYFAWGPDGPNISTETDSLDFGSVITGDSTDLDLVVRNVGNQNLNISGITLSDSTNFSNTDTLPVVLAAGASHTFTVTYVPSIVTTHNATLSFASDDADEPTFDIALSGQGKSGQFFIDGSKSAGGNGQSWTTAFDSIAAAMASGDVLAGSELWVRAGTYGPAELSKAVTVYGGFAGGEASLNQRDVETNETILDGGGSSRGLNVTVEAADGTLDGFIIQNGFVGDYMDGAGVKISAPGFTLANSRIKNNVAGGSTSSSGGGISVMADSVVVSDCKVLDNSANDNGGGLYYYLGTTGTGLTVRDSSLTGNVAGFRGGGITVYGSNNTLITVERCIIAGNQATLSGGGIYAALTNLNLYSSLIHSNIADPVGTAGAGIINSGITTILNCTVVNNHDTAGTGGGGIYLDSTFGGSAVVSNSIVWGNGGLHYGDEPGINDGALQISERTEVAVVTYSNIQGPQYGDYTTGDPDANHNMRRTPGFVDPDGADNDADTWQDNDYRLLAGSYCLDYGNGDLAPTTDLYDNPRFDDLTIPDNGSGTPTYSDIGAHELQNRTPLTIHVDPAATGTGTGESWVDAVTSVNTGAAMAVDGAEVWVRAGTYLLATPIVLERAATMYGGFAGTETARYQRNWIANPTVLDGQHNDYRCVHILADAIIDGFTVTGGVGLNSGGGGIFVQGGSPTISHCKIQDNQAVSGGGIYIADGPLTTIDSCTIVDNFATGMDGCSTGCGLGGGIYLTEYTNELADTTIRNCVIAGNRSASSGGGIRSVSGLSVINSTITNNKTYQIGGIYQNSYDSSPFTVTNSVIWGNIGIYDNRQIIGSDDLITYSDVQGSYTGTGNSDLLPQFVNAGSWDDNGTPADITDDIWHDGDYHLLAASPCIDSGTTVGAPTVDIELIARPQGAEVDMGAHEFYSYAIGGEISGLVPGNSVILQNNGGDDLTLDTDGNFTFATTVVGGGAYAVTVLTQPTTPDQTCNVSNGGGTISGADVSNVSVSCNDPCSSVDYHVVNPQFSALPSSDTDRVVFFDSSQSLCYEMVSCVKESRTCIDEWNFGGSGSIIARNNEHDIFMFRYVEAGDYTANLTMTEQISGTTATANLTATAEIVQTPLPFIDFETSVDPTTPTVSLTIPDADIDTVIVFWGDRERTEYNGSFPATIEKTYSRIDADYKIRIMTVTGTGEVFKYTYTYDEDLTISIP